MQSYMHVHVVQIVTIMVDMQSTDADIWDGPRGGRSPAMLGTALVPMMITMMVSLRGARIVCCYSISGFYLG